jgi:hypothetical protein
VTQRVANHSPCTIQFTFEFAEFLLCHFDGKKRLDVTTGTKKEYISVAVSGPGMEKEKFLLDCAVEEGTGLNVAEVVRDALVAWGILNRIKALSFDTTSVNTGLHLGKFMGHLNSALCGSCLATPFRNPSDTRHKGTDDH